MNSWRLLFQTRSLTYITKKRRCFASRNAIISTSLRKIFFPIFLEHWIVRSSSAVELRFTDELQGPSYFMNRPRLPVDAAYMEYNLLEVVFRKNSFCCKGRRSICGRFSCGPRKTGSSCGLTNDLTDTVGRCYSQPLHLWSWH